MAKSKKNNFRRGRGSKDQKRQSARRQDFERTSDSTDKLNSYNDISWYNKYPLLLDTTAKFPYPYRPGMQVPNTSGSTTKNLWIPGVMRLNWCPAVGVSSKPTDPASLVGRQMYDRVRKAYSGSIEADPPDFVTYVLCLDSIFALIAHMKRLYRISTAYSPDNRVTPDLLITALGYKGDDVRANKVELLRATNQFIYTMRGFVAPMVMDYFNRHYWMNDNVYTDAPSINSQFYVFNMERCFKYLFSTTSNLPVAQMNSVAVGTIADLITFVGSVIQAFMAWDDCYLISGYLSRAYEGVPSFSIAELSPDEQFSPVYEPEVLSQIENSRPIPSPAFYMGNNDLTTTWYLNVTQDPATNSVVCTPTVEYASANAMDETEVLGFMRPQPFLSARSDIPTVQENVIMSRLQMNVLTLNLSADKKKVTYTFSCGSEVLLSIALLPSTAGAGGGTLPLYPIATVPSVGDTLTRGQSQLMQALIMKTQFDWAPIVMLHNNKNVAGSLSNTEWTVVGDIHNLTVVTTDQMGKLHEVCLYSEFGSFQ